MSQITKSKYEKGIIEQAKNGELDGIDLYIAHYLFDVPLTPKQAEIYKRYKYIDRLRGEGWDKRHIVAKLTEGDKGQGFGPCKQRTAREAYAKAFQVFGDYDKQDKELERNFKIGWYERRAMEVMQHAEEGKLEWKDAYEISKKYQDMAVKLRGLLEPDNDWVDPQAWSKQEFHLVSDDPEILEAAFEDVTDEYEEEEGEEHE